MGYPSKVRSGDSVVFSVCSHDSDTGILTDADAAPKYQLYEDESGASIHSGYMAKLDDANTTGFYTETISCTVGNGFEAAKTYTIYIVATVSGNQGGICYAFKLRPIEKLYFGVKNP